MSIFSLRNPEYPCSFEKHTGRQRRLLLLFGCGILGCQFRSILKLCCAVHVSKFTVRSLSPCGERCQTQVSYLLPCFFGAVYLNTPVKQAVFALFTLERSQVGFRKGKIISSGLQADICREMWRLPHNQTFRGLTYFSHVSPACLKFIFGLVAAQHHCWVIMWHRALCHAADPQEGSESHLPIQTAERSDV